MDSTSDLKLRDHVRLARNVPSETGPAAQAEIPPALTAQAASVRTRRGQTLPLTVNGEEEVFLVRSGVLMLRITFPGELRQVVALLLPGDVFRSTSAPPGADVHLSSAIAGEVLRLHWRTFASLAANDSALARYFEDAVTKQTAYQAIHMAALGRFECRQRVATYLLELALRTGTKSPCGGVGFETPLTRIDMADYLGLNADTLSRVMSRLRASRVVSQPERHRLVVRDFAALAALTPAAQSLMALCGAQTRS